MPRTTIGSDRSGFSTFVRISLCNFNCIDAGAGILINGAGVSVCRRGVEVRHVRVCICALICGLEQLPGPVHFSLLCLGVCISFGMHNYLQGILSLD